VALQHIRKIPVPLQKARPDLPVELCAIVHKMMAKDANQRYASCAELIKELTRFKESLAGQKSFASAGGPKAAPTGTLSGTRVLLTGGRGRLLVAVSASLLLAFCGGGAFAWIRHRDRSAGAAPAPPVVATPEKSEEQRLREDAVQDADPGEDGLALARGVANRLQYGQLLLQQHRLDEAGQFFVTLQKSPVKQYNMLGRLGQAIVLAYENKPHESNHLFLELVHQKPAMGLSFERMPMLFTNKALRREIGRALDYNLANATAEQPFPPELNFLRDPLRLAENPPVSPRRGAAVNAKGTKH
jgi:serine/threonine-protein kinase